MLHLVFELYIYLKSFIYIINTDKKNDLQLLFYEIHINS